MISLCSLFLVIPDLKPYSIFQYHKGRKRKNITGNVEGAGLVLALVKQLITANGGQIECESEIGRGSTFSLSLPSR